MFDPYSKVDEFLNNNLLGQELEVFKNAMANDPELRIVVENHNIYSSVADEIINESISAKIKMAQQSQGNGRSIIRKILWFLAASLLIVLSIYYYSLRSENSFSEQLYAEFYFPPYDMNRGAKVDPAINVDCEKAHGYIELNEIEKATEALMKNLNAEDVSCKEKSFYLLALLKIKDGDYPSAQKFLRNVLDNEESGYEDNARKLLEKLK